MKIFTFTIIFCISGLLSAQNIRPVFDNIGFVWKADQVNILMNYLRTNNRVSESNAIPIAGICPHDDYLFAGDVSYPLISEIEAEEIVIFGVTHGTARKLLNNPEKIVILDNFDKWKAPFGPVEISPLRDYIKKKLDNKYFIVNNSAHEKEHSIEAMIPYLQYFNKNVKVTPIMVTAMEFDDMSAITSQLSEIIGDYMKENSLRPGRDIFFLFSCDASHYGPDFKNTVYGTGEIGHKKGVEADIRIAENYLEGPITSEKIKGFMTDKNQCNAVWCGKYSVPFGLMTTINIIKKIDNQKMSGNILKYSDSYSHGVLPIKGHGFGITAPFSTEHWVGHLSVIYF